MIKFHTHLLNPLTARWVGRENDYDVATKVALRAPELVLQSGYDSKIDIWAVGCMVRRLSHGKSITITNNSWSVRHSNC